MAELPEPLGLPEDPPSGQRANILLVDDQPANLLALEAILEDLGHHLVRAHSGEEALQRLRGDDFAVVLLDVQMPGLDGFETARLIRGRDESRRTPIIFVTAYESDRFPVEQGYSLGAVDYLVKPLVPVIVRAKVAGFVELFETTRQVKRQAERIRQMERREFEQALAGGAARLLEQQEQWRATVHSIGDAVLTTDAEGRVTFLNPVAESLTGWPQREAAGQPLDRVFPIVNESTGRPVENPVERVLREGAVVGLGNHTVLIARDGTGRPIDDSAAPIKDAQGRLTGVVLVFRDVTEQRQAEKELRAAEDHLRRSERELADFFENATIGLHWVGPDGIILRTNQAELDLLGYTREEYLGRHIADFHADEEVIGDILRRLQAGENLHDYPARLRCKDGSIRDVLIHSSVMWQDGKFVHTRCFTRDITEQKRATQALRDSEQRFARFMQHLPGLAWVKDLRGRYVYANDAAEKAFGTPREVLYGKTDEEVFPPAVAAQFRDNDRRALGGGAGVQVIETLEDQDGVLRHSLVSKFPILGPDGTAVLVGGVAIDVTDRLRAEQALREADRLKDEFLAMLAHELRNPLAPVRNALHIMKQPATDGAILRQVRDMAERQVQHMARLLDDLLDVSRISRGRIELRKEAVDVTAVIGRTVEAVRPLIEERRHEFTVSLPPGPLRVEADPTRLEQVLTNLLNNAAKYTDPGGHVWLSAGRDGAEVAVWVRDTGIGIAPDMLPRIFDLFVQAERRLDRSQGGVGIGLTLVKKLVELHGGRIEAASAGLGRGSEFVVRLPALPDRPPAENAQAPGGDKAARPSRHRVLVVDDNQDAADSLAVLLRLAGQDVRAAYDGPSALTQAGDFRPALVLLDIGMPGMDGYEVARRLRDEPGLRGVVLVALTGWGQEEDRRRSREAGFDHHLIKPVEPAELMKLLAERQPPPA